MRRSAGLVVIALCMLMASCAPAQPPAAPTESESTPQQTIESAVRDAASTVTSVTVTRLADRNFSWRIEAIMSSAPDTATLDRAAARVLSVVGSLDSSASPVAVTFKSRDLAPSGASSEWGALDYRWEPSGGIGENRGDVVWLFHSETTPPGAMSEGWREAAARGTWRDASVESLDEWSRDGTPDL